MNALKNGAATMDENRRASRRRVLKGGTIEFDRGAFSCIVRNFSDTRRRARGSLCNTASL
jgi:hypothetical protein